MKYQGKELPPLPDGFRWELMQKEPAVRSRFSRLCCWINSPRYDDFIKDFTVVEAAWADVSRGIAEDRFNYVKGFATMDDAIAYVVQAINMGIIV